MSRVIWEGIPARYWPSTEKPWRVSWGYGAFKDFATRDEAQAFYETTRGGGITEPFNAVETDDPHHMPGAVI